MALTRKSLSAMGIETEKIDEIITLHSETVEALKEQRDGYKAEADKIPGLEQERDDAKKELAKMQKAQEKDEPYKQKYEEVKKEFDDYKKGIEEKDTKAKLTEAYKQVLKDAKIADKYINVILKATDLNQFKLDEEGNIEGAKEESEKAAKEWAEFVETTTKEGKKTENPPNNIGGGKKMTIEEIDAIEDTEERQKAMLENRELYNI